MQLNKEMHKNRIDACATLSPLFKLRDFTVAFLPLQKFGRAPSLFLRI